MDSFLPHLESIMKRPRWILIAIACILSVVPVGASFAANAPALYDETGHRKRHYASCSPLQRSFEKSGGVLYRQSVLTQEEYDTLDSDLQRLPLTDETASIAHNRVGAVVPHSSTTHQILRQGSMCRLVKSIVGADYELSNEIPVELRIYEKTSAGMDWHVDDVLYDPPQVEMVYTLENTSDCTTRWNECANEKKQGVVVETDPNSVVLLRAGGVAHCVTPLKRGRRVIVKCAYIAKDAVFRKDDMVAQFASKKSARKRQRKR